MITRRVFQPLRAALACVALALCLASPARAHAFDSVSQGAIFDAGIGTTPVGDSLLGELGGQSVGLRRLGKRWLIQWDGLVALKGGTLAAAHPYTALVGGHARLFAESGYRFSPGRWSPYLGLRLSGDLQALLPPGHGFGDLDTINNIDGVGDLNLSGAVRIAGGASFLAGRRSLLVDLFAQEDGRIGETNLPAAAFTDVGLTLRFDLERSLEVTAEGFWGATGSKSTPALQLTDTTTHLGATVSARKIFANAMWLGATLADSVERDSVRYQSPDRTFDTQSAPTFSFVLLYGFPLGSQR